MPFNPATKLIEAIRRCAAECSKAPSILLTAFALCSAITPARAEPFIGQFELKTLKAAPGSYEFQSQNAWSWDQPSRRIERDDPDGVAMDENAVARQRHAFELEIGLTSFLKMRVGVEFEKERFDEVDTIDEANDFDTLQFSEIGAELVATLMPREGDGAGLGFVAEVEGPWDQEESNNLSLGSIIEYQSGHWFAAVVPMIVHSFRGETEEGSEVDNKWDFAYAAQLMHTLSQSWSVAFEGYGTVERLGDSGRPSEAAQTFGDFDQHRAGAVFYYSHEFGSERESRVRAGAASLSSAGDEEEGTSLTVGLGMLEGLNENTPDHTLKLSIEVDF